MPAFLSVLERYRTDIRDRRRRLMEFFTALTVFHVSDPTKQLLPVLFEQGTLEDHIAFASHLGHFLRKMQQPTKAQIWDCWLRGYWQDRLQGMPAALDELEIRAMLNWLPHLGDAYPVAAILAIRFPTVAIKQSHTLFELRDSELVSRFPSETAELLIYLSKCDFGYYAVDLATINARLTSIPPELRRSVDEAFARAGIPKSTALT